MEEADKGCVIRRVVKKTDCKTEELAAELELLTLKGVNL